MKLFKKITVMSAAVAMAVSMMSVGASADYVNSLTYNTSGGTNGYVRIKSGVYKGSYEPSGGVHITTYGARAEITNASTATTTFNLTGVLYNSTSSTPWNIIS